MFNVTLDPIYSAIINLPNSGGGGGGGISNPVKNKNKNVSQKPVQQ